MPLHVSSTCVHNQEVKIALHSLWYHQTYRCDDTKGCVMQFWPPDYEHMCSKHVEAWNKLTVKQKFCASSWLITEINILGVFVALLFQHAMRYISFCSLSDSNFFSTLSHKLHKFRKIVIDYVCFDFLYKFSLKYFSFLEELREIWS